MKFFKEVDVRVDFSSIKYENSKPLGYIKTACMHYEENGQSKRWDIVESLDSVCIALFDVSKQAFVLVRQFRPRCFTQGKMAILMSFAQDWQTKRARAWR